MFFNLFFILQFVLPKSNPTSKNSNPSQEHQGKEKTNYHLSLFHWWTRVLPFIPNKNNFLGLKTQITWPLKIKNNSYGLKTQTAWSIRQTPARTKQNDRSEEELRRFGGGGGLIGIGRGERGRSDPPLECSLSLNRSSWPPCQSFQLASPPPPTVVLSLNPAHSLFSSNLNLSCPLNLHG